MEFFHTVMGHRFFEGQLPALIDNLGRIADSLEQRQLQQNALLVISRTEHIRDYLMKTDPKALEQVDRAIT